MLIDANSGQDPGRLMMGGRGSGLPSSNSSGDANDEDYLHSGSNDPQKKPDPDQELPAVDVTGVN